MFGLAEKIEGVRIRWVDGDELENMINWLTEGVEADVPVTRERKLTGNKGWESTTVRELQAVRDQEGALLIAYKGEEGRMGCRLVADRVKAGTGLGSDGSRQLVMKEEMEGGRVNLRRYVVRSEQAVRSSSFNVSF